MCNSPECNSFIDILNSYNLRLTVNEPTRITASSSTLIDNIIVSNDLFSCIHDIQVIDTMLSDHEGILLSLTSKLESPQATASVVYKRQFSEANINNFMSLLDAINWPIFFSKDDCFDVQFENFHKKFTDLFKSCFPFKKIRSKAKKGIPWFCRFKGFAKKVTNPKSIL